MGVLTGGGGGASTSSSAVHVTTERLPLCALSNSSIPPDASETRAAGAVAAPACTPLRRGVHPSTWRFLPLSTSSSPSPCTATAHRLPSLPLTTPCIRLYWAALPSPLIMTRAPTHRARQAGGAAGDRLTSTGRNVRRQRSQPRQASTSGNTPNTGTICVADHDINANGDVLLLVRGGL